MDDSKKQNDILKEHLQEHSNDSSEEVIRVWNSLDSIKEEMPSESIDSTFYSMLERETKRSNPTAIKTTSPYEWVWKIAATFLIGGMLGYIIALQNGRPEAPSTAQLEQQVKELQTEVVKVNLSSPRASNRFQTLVSIKDQSVLTSELIGILEETVKKDPSVNVRLGALEVLSTHLTEAEFSVFAGRVLPVQTNAIMQLAIFDVLLNQQNRQSGQSIQNLLDDSTIDVDVRQEVENKLQQI